MPYDAYAVTATGMGIRLRVPSLGRPHRLRALLRRGISDAGQPARLYTIHIFIVPSLLAIVIGAHLPDPVKQKHTQPGYARRAGRAGQSPRRAALALSGVARRELVLLMFGALFLLSPCCHRIR